MKTKIVYAVTSDEKDIYLEQTYVSICSLKKYHPNAYIVLVVDQITDTTLCGRRNYITNFITEKIVVNTPSNYNKVERSRFLKTTLRKYIVGDFLFIDSDTIIISEINEVDNFKGDVCAVLDCHISLDQHPAYERLIKKQAKQIGWDIKSVYYFNSGFMFVRDNETTHHLYNRWNEEWEKSRLNMSSALPSDQPSLGKVNEELGHVIKEIDGVWNCQISCNGLRYFDNAKILHYFSSTITKSDKEHIYALMNKEVFFRLKETGELDQRLLEIINSPKAQFPNRIIMVSGSALDTYYSNFVQIIYYLSVKHRVIFNILDKVCKIVYKMH